jgi:hypothetical protein
MLGSVTLLCGIGMWSQSLGLFWGAFLQNWPKLHLCFGNSKKTMRSRFQGVDGRQCFQGNIFPRLALPLSFAESDCGGDHHVCFGAPCFKTGQNCICVFEIPRKPSVPDFGPLCGLCFPANISQSLARSLSFSELDCRGDHWICFGMLEIPRKPSVPGVGVVDSQCFRGNIFQCLDQSLSSVKLDCGVDHHVCFGTPRFGNWSK